ncbi:MULTISPECIES: hypothetical protein [Clostridia]|uniref:hypothetical protein n=1 Tax=Dorea formicigenerans TaxID=39486 RepID=UPI001D1455E9|nr:hypothetical protein [[Clostridium] innocuum]
MRINIFEGVQIPFVGTTIGSACVFFTAVVGFWIGILFLLALDYLIPHLHVGSDQAEGPKSKFDDDLGCGTGVRGEE